MRTVHIQLPDEHPGVFDTEYRARRAEIAAASIGLVSGAAPPHVDYTAAENVVWATVATTLAGLHESLAIDEYRRGAAALALPQGQVPQLSWVSDRLFELTGWRVAAVPGLVPIREFYGSLAEKVFLSTQYVRHPSVPFYTPEPDIIHELIGHVNALASPRLAPLYEAAGGASLRAAAEGDAALERFSRVFWFTLEFGVVRERGELRAYGAGLLSSFGEIQTFRNATIRPFDIAAMTSFEYDITRFQDVLFGADSFVEVESQLLGW